MELQKSGSEIKDPQYKDWTVVRPLGQTSLLLKRDNNGAVYDIMTEEVFLKFNYRVRIIEYDLKYFDSTGQYAYLPMMLELAEHKMKSNQHLHVECYENFGDLIEIGVGLGKIEYKPSEYLKLIKHLEGGLIGGWKGEQLGGEK